VRLERRNLFVTLRMLAAAGIVFDESAARRAAARGALRRRASPQDRAGQGVVGLGAGATLPR